MSLYLLDTFQFPVYGEQDFYCLGPGVEQLWTVPAGVTRISAVLIGGGGGGGLGENQKEQDGGGGAGLRYINSMPVVPGEVLKISVGCGGSAITVNTLGTLSVNELNGLPGTSSYIASINNASVSGRTGIGDTIIVWAGAGNTQTVNFTSLVGNVPRTTTGGGGGGSTPGTYAWGTIAGGNGGLGGSQSNRGGGATDGGGGGAAGWVNGTTGGNGAFLEIGTQNEQGNDPPTDGAAGGGGGGMYTAGGGGNGAGGGGGTGVIWGQGPSGKGAQNDVPLTTAEFFSWSGQGGSYGADGLAQGNETFTVTSFTNAMGLATPPAAPWNYNNKSLGNGTRGFYNQEGDDDNGTLTGVFPPNMGSGGLFGGGGGGADITGQGTPQSGAGGDGVVRIIFVGRFNRTRNYPTPSFNNILSNWGFPTNPPYLGGPRLDQTPNVVGSILPDEYPASTSRGYTI